MENCKKRSLRSRYVSNLGPFPSRVLLAPPAFPNTAMLLKRLLRTLKTTKKPLSYSNKQWLPGRTKIQETHENVHPNLVLVLFFWDALKWNAGIWFNESSAWGNVHKTSCKNHATRTRGIKCLSLLKTSRTSFLLNQIP